MYTEGNQEVGAVCLAEHGVPVEVQRGREAVSATLRPSPPNHPFHTWIGSREYAY